MARRTRKKAKSTSRTRKKAARKTSKRKTTKKRAAKRTRKKTTKKASRKKAKRAPRAPKSKIEKHEGLINFIIAIALFVIIVVIFSLLKIQFGQGAVVAKVNGEPIHGPDIDRAYDRLPPQLQQAYTPEIVLEQLISERLLLQKIKELGITASDEEIEQAIQSFIDERGIERDALEKALKLQGISKTEFKDLIRNQVLVAKLFENVYADLEVTESESLEYYNDNAESFVIPELINVRHIMLGIGNFTDDELRLQSLELFENLKANGFENFCELVEQHSADIQSRETCGAYEVSKYSGLPEEFVNASIALNDGEAAIVKTGFGYHIIRRLSVSPEKLPRFEDLKPQIEIVLLQSKKSAAYKDYLRELRENAVIENYLVDEVLEEIEEDVKEVATQKNVCLIKSATLYGAAWDSVTKEQVKLLEDENMVVGYVECSPGEFDEQAEECQQAGIEAYPSWIINGEKFLGLQSPERVNSLSGC